MRPNLNNFWDFGERRHVPPRKTGIIEGLVFSLLTSSSLTIGLAGSALAITAITGAVTVGLTIGLSYLANSFFRPKAPRPEDVQQSTRQPTQPRVRHYGRVKVSGPWVFAEAWQGDFQKVLAIGQGPIDGIEEYWVDDRQVTLTGTGECLTSPWDAASRPGTSVGALNIQTRLGANPEINYASLTSVHPGWTVNHRGDGIASLLATQRSVEDKNYLSTFPNGVNTNYRLVIRGAKVKSPSTGVVAWDDNAASLIRDYITHADGMRLPESLVATPLAQAGMLTAFNWANDAIPTKAGSEPRYRLWGSYTLEERPADVLGRMLQSCDGRLVPTPDGGLTLDIGRWQEPTVTLDADSIVAFTEVGRGRDILTSANTIRAKYLDPNQDYQAADADPWVDAADVTERGEIASDFEFIMSPSHSQTRRLMKLASYRANPAWVGQFQCNLKALAAFGKRLVRVNFQPLGINAVFEVQDFRFNIGEGGILQGVTLQLQSMPQAAYTWDAAQEEGDAPVSDESEGDSGIPTPPAPTVTIIAGPKARLSFSLPPSLTLHLQARGKATADSTWTDIPVVAGETTATSGVLAATTAYEFQLRYVSQKGRLGNWSPSAPATTP